MDFTVHFTKGGSRPFIGARRRFLEPGVLEVTSEGRRYHYSPAAWSSVEEDTPKGPPPPSVHSAVLPKVAAPDPDEPDWRTRQF